MKVTRSGVPHVHPATIESIISEVFSKNEDFGVKEFMSSMEKENADMCFVLYTFINSIADTLSKYNEEQREEFCALAKMACHLMYKSMEKQMEINLLEN